MGNYLDFGLKIAHRGKEDLKSASIMPDLKREVAYYYVSFGAYRGRMDNPLFMISTTVDRNRAEVYQKKVDSTVVQAYAERGDFEA